ncbi:MAG: hypothetical protein D6790_15030 [Caldilineae bacterium]|nr:MAG: hypothetical protein D6790_15030 [Caldilineae bacterium]
MKVLFPILDRDRLWAFGLADEMRREAGGWACHDERLLLERLRLVTPAHLYDGYEALMLRYAAHDMMHALPDLVMMSRPATLAAVPSRDLVASMDSEWSEAVSHGIDLLRVDDSHEALATAAAEAAAYLTTMVRRFMYQEDIDFYTVIHHI